MGYFQVRNDSRVVIYDRRAFIRLATDCHSIVFDSRHLSLGKRVDVQLLTDPFTKKQTTYLK